jgi:carboxylesterase type B
MKLYKRFVLIALCGLALPAYAQQRSGGGRGAVDQATVPQNNPRAEQLLVLSDRLNRVAALSPAWWTNTALITRLGITDDQKARIERTFESHRLKLETAKAALEKEETQLGQLLNAETFDRNAALTQAFRVIQARSEMERENTLMTVEMREHLTQAQWIQLPQPSLSLSYFVNEGGRAGRRLEIIGEGGRGQRGQQ